MNQETMEARVARLEEEVRELRRQLYRYGRLLQDGGPLQAEAQPPSSQLQAEEHSGARPSGSHLQAAPPPGSQQIGAHPPGSGQQTGAHPPGSGQQTGAHPPGSGQQTGTHSLAGPNQAASPPQAGHLEAHSKEGPLAGAPWAGQSSAAGAAEPPLAAGHPAAGWSGASAHSGAEGRPGQPGAAGAGAGANSPRPPVDWERQIGQIWLPRIFIVVLLIGVLWGFLAAASAGYITPAIRCWIGLAASATMFGLGVRWMKQDRRALAQTLLGGANGVLVLTLFAAHMLYGFIGPAAAFALYVAAVLLFVGCSLRYRSQALMLAAGVAGALVPFLVDSVAPSLPLFIGYEAAFAGAALLLSYRFGFRIAYVLSYVLLLPPMLFGGVSADGPGERWLVLGALLLHYGLQLGLSLRDAEFAKRPERQGLLLASFALNAAWLHELAGPSGYRWTIAALSLLLAGAAFGFRSLDKDRMRLYAAASTLGWVLLAFDAASYRYLGPVLLAQGVASLYLGLRLSSWMQKTAAAATLFLGVGLVLNAPIREAWSEETFGWLALLAAWAAMYFLLRPLRHKELPSGPGPLLLWSGGLLVLVFLTQLTLVLAETLDPDRRSLVLSAVWVAYAVALFAIGLLAHKSKVRAAGIVLLFLTLIKVIFVDLPGVSTAVRAVLFIGLGVVGILASRLLYRKQQE
ncbi:DUF2339 domain-containing protein [Paenibacillus sp. B01]|uniref:DUF2339 domain-containing protein n=1 Tax=Paenibacillus sp. B01 TaxID=2660554 RepID=UPI00129BBDF3|nr:DUF2339 domain-containing protein [Paenibacillus sp. B01]QGG57118.1 DUF2339 domain-containing protein [Paenibacillus sp. B01]